MGIISNIRGIIGNIFRLGLNGPQLKNNSGVIEHRNSDDTGFAIARGDTPVGDNDLVTKLYADTLEKPLIISRQADTSVSLPTNTATRGFVVVTTPGSGAVIGDVLYDDGSGSGTMTILSAIEGRTIAVTDALTGGSIAFDPDSTYIWDDDGSEWIKIGDIGSVVGAVRQIRFAINTGPTVDSTNQIPAGARVVYCGVEVDTAYDAGATIEVGTTGTSDAFQATTENLPQTEDTYVTEQDTLVSSASVVRVTIGGSPSAGSGVAVVRFTASLA